MFVNIWPAELLCSSPRGTTPSWVHRDFPRRIVFLLLSMVPSSKSFRGLPRDLLKLDILCFFCRYHPIAQLLV